MKGLSLQVLSFSFLPSGLGGRTVEREDHERGYVGVFNSDLGLPMKTLVLGPWSSFLPRGTGPKTMGGVPGDSHPRRWVLHVHGNPHFPLPLPRRVLGSSNLS